MSTPEDLRAALARVPEAERKWLALEDWERQRYVDWVDGPHMLRRRRIRGTVMRVLWDRPQRGFWGRMREGASTLGDELASGRHTPMDGAP